MSRKKTYGDSVWDNDPGPEPDFTEEEEFEIHRDTGSKPENFANKAKGQRYAEWSKRQGGDAK